jgi:hypothetical protein
VASGVSIIRSGTLLGVENGVAVGLGPLSQHPDRVDEGTAELGSVTGKIALTV